jgi:hypothetical protein
MNKEGSMLGVDIGAVAVATVAMFVVGAVWYTGLFAKMWGEMFGFDKLSKQKQDEMRKAMGPQMALQFVVTAMTALALAKLMALAPNYAFYKLALIVWAGLLTPVVVSGVIFGGVEARWVKRRIWIMSLEALAHIMAATWIINMMQN